MAILGSALKLESVENLTVQLWWFGKHLGTTSAYRVWLGQSRLHLQRGRRGLAPQCQERGHDMAKGFGSPQNSAGRKVLVMTILISKVSKYLSGNQDSLDFARTNRPNLTKFTAVVACGIRFTDFNRCNQNRH